MKVDQCQHCTVRGDLDACKVTLCNQHESWYAVTMQAKIADLEAAEEGAKIAFGDVVDQKHALTKRCKSLEASIAAMRDIISTQAARIAALEADAARLREAMLDAVEKLNASEPALNGDGWTLAPIRNEMLSALGETK